MENYVRIYATNIKIRKARTKEYIYVHSHHMYFLQKDSFRSQFTSVHSSYDFWVFLLTAGKTAQLETKGAIPPSSRNQLQA